ncbi:unnamed protein product [Didymodactylos carnosus]|uniref:AB hydrolase-1 domain-containing protein n=1 Tax=Didymodactylos carnosus TaxID=1234261 RepID=A0A813X5P1_9BILA|nr:unnamed protein product [Didymodactylos carnosus]CAF0865258.1 unnamed protein product [Didymodactylos carnosus]CAF3512904.1 unnamed protein product [Didymodactylos carnosus]CAF3652789.1 unnamed protein product [Didymodactylos carnosus]
MKLSIPTVWGGYLSTILLKNDILLPNSVTTKIIGIHGWLDNLNSLLPLSERLLKTQSQLRNMFIRSIGNNLRDLRMVVQKIGWSTEKFVLIGHSFGAALALSYAAMYPDDVKSVVAIDILIPIAHSDRMKASRKGITDDATKLLMERSVKTDSDGNLYFTFDDALKFPTIIPFTRDMAYEAFRQIKVPILFIGTNEPQWQRSEESIQLLKECNPNFETEFVDGPHHLHMTQAERYHPLNMSSTSDSPAPPSPVDLMAELYRLQSELEIAQTNNQQAAAFGLAVMEERKQIQLQYQELESEHEIMKSELETLQRKLKNFQLNKREETLKGVSNEETLLHEKQVREDYLLKEISKFENELRFTKQDNQRINKENEKLSSNIQELNESNRELDDLKIKLKHELKDSKANEQRLLDANTELEDDNIGLQQQVAKLRENLIDYDGMKHENKRLQEEVDDLHSQIDELINLRRIAEKQLEDIHSDLREEREQKHLYKKQLEHKIQQESRRNLDTLAAGLRMVVSDGRQQDNMDQDGSDGDVDDDNIDSTASEYVRIENDLISEQQPVGNLFSEVHGNEIKKLELECNQLLEIKTKIEQELSDINDKTKLLIKKIYYLSQTIQHHNVNKTDYEQNENDTKLLLNDAMTYVDNLDKVLIKHNGDHDLLKKKSDEQEHNISKLKQDLNVMMKQCNDIQTTLNKTHDDLDGSEICVSEELDSLNHQLCVASAIPNEDNDIKQQIRQHKSDNINNNKIIDPFICQKLLETINEQIKQLKQTIDKTSSIKQLEVPVSVNGDSAVAITPIPTVVVNDLPNDTKEEAQDQIIKLHKLLTTKREQIATLRTVVKANKQTAEIALANLKSKYENEKLIVTETMSKLRNELKSLKEDAATFASLRAMFAARCDEYVTQLDELQRQVHAAEEEKKTLNSLLRMAIQQKLALTQKLEDIEMDNERVNNSVRRSNNTNSHSSTVIIPTLPLSPPSSAATTPTLGNSSLMNTNVINNGNSLMLNNGTTETRSGRGSGRFIPPRSFILFIILRMVGTVHKPINDIKTVQIEYLPLRIKKNDQQQNKFNPASINGSNALLIKANSVPPLPLVSSLPIWYISSIPLPCIPPLPLTQTEKIKSYPALKFSKLTFPQYSSSNINYDYIKNLQALIAAPRYETENEFREKNATHLKVKYSQQQSLEEPQLTLQKTRVFQTKQPLQLPPIHPDHSSLLTRPTAHIFETRQQIDRHEPYVRLPFMLRPENARPRIPSIFPTRKYESYTN